MRLIDADAVKENVNDTDYMPTDKWVSLSDLEAIPAIYAVPVVRCKDCKYFHQTPRLINDSRTDGVCEWISDCHVELDHYCSWGIERSEK